MSRGRISRRPAQETGAAAFSRRCKGPALAELGSFLAKKEARTQPGKGGGHRTHLEDDGGRYLDSLRTREGPCGALLGQIALLARPHALARRAARERELLSLAKNLTSQNSQS